MSRHALPTTCMVCDTAPRQGSTVRMRRLGEVLRTKRRQAHLTPDTAAADVGWTVDQVTGLESGERAVGDTELISFLLLCQVRSKEIRRLVVFNREAGQDTWLETFHDDPALRVRTPMREEARASAITGYHPMLVPGPLRTSHYTQAMCGLDQPDQRHENLRRVDAVFYLDEHVPGRVVGGPAVMRDQITHLLDSSATTLIIPARSTVTCEGFTLLDNASGNSVVHAEMPVANLYLERPDDVDSYRTVATRLADVAWDTDRSRELLVHWAERHSLVKP